MGRKKKKIKINYLKKNIINFSKKININNNAEKDVSYININNDITNKKITMKNQIYNNNINFKNDYLMNEPIKTTKYEILFTYKQKSIIDDWMNAYIDMYNSVIKRIKDTFKNELAKNSKLKLQDLEVDLNISKLKKIFKDTKSKLSESTKINMHILDYAINDACAMFKSKVSNLKNGHIKKSKLRFLKKSKSTKIIKIENHLCSKTSFCSSIMGHIETCPKINFVEDISIVSIVQYNKKKDKYYLLVRDYLPNPKTDDKISYEYLLGKNKQLLNTCEEFKKMFPKKNNGEINEIISEVKKTKNTIKRSIIKDTFRNYRKKQSTNTNSVSFDPGVRTFLTGLSNNHTIEYGMNLSDILEEKIKNMDRIRNNNNIHDVKKEKILTRLSINLTNKVNDIHWKIINDIVNNYKHVLIGNMSTKSICEGNLQKMTKRIAKCIRLYVFRERLKYKCYVNGIKYHLVDEWCTSKTCSNCAYYNKNLGGSKIYNCVECKQISDRDINASKNILIQSIQQ